MTVLDRGLYPVGRWTVFFDRCHFQDISWNLLSARPGVVLCGLPQAVEEGVDEVRLPLEDELTAAYAGRQEERALREADRRYVCTSKSVGHEISLLLSSRERDICRRKYLDRTPSRMRSRVTWKLLFPSGGRESQLDGILEFRLKGRHIDVVTTHAKRSSHRQLTQEGFSRNLHSLDNGR